MEKLPNGLARRWSLTLQVSSVIEEPGHESILHRLWYQYTQCTQIRTKSLTFLQGQVERASTGQLHVQAAAAFSSPTRMTTLKKWIPGAHWEPAREWNSLLKYVTKEDTRVAGPWTIGEAQSQGQRSDLSTAAELILSGSTMTTIATTMPETTVRYYKGLLYLKSLTRQERYQPKKVGLFWGSTGTGKTFTAFEELEDIYTVFDTKTPWFDGYSGQDNVLLDECGLGMMNYNYLKRLLDGYRMDVPIKGGSVQWTPKTVILTSNIPLEDWYPQIPKEDLEALQRRIRAFKFPEEKQLATAWIRGALIEPPAAKRVQEPAPTQTPENSMDWLQKQNMDTYDLFGY